MIDDVTSGVIIKRNGNRRVVGDVRTVAPDDCTTWSSLKHHVIAVVACKVQLIDRLDYNQLDSSLQLHHTTATLHLNNIQLYTTRPILRSMEKGYSLDFASLKMIRRCAKLFSAMFKVLSFIN